MLTNIQLRDLLGLPRNTKTRQVLNRAIREYAPGGAELLDRLEKIDWMRHKAPANRQVSDELAILHARRDRLVEDIRAGRIPITPRRPDAR